MATGASAVSRPRQAQVSQSRTKTEGRGLAKLVPLRGQVVGTLLAVLAV